MRCRRPKSLLHDDGDIDSTILSPFLGYPKVLLYSFRIHHSKKVNLCRAYFLLVYNRISPFSSRLLPIMIPNKSELLI